MCRSFLFTQLALTGMPQLSLHFDGATGVPQLSLHTDGTHRYISKLPPHKDGAHRYYNFLLTEMALTRMPQLSLYTDGAHRYMPQLSCQTGDIYDTAF